MSSVARRRGPAPGLSFPICTISYLTLNFHGPLCSMVHLFARKQVRARPPELRGLGLDSSSVTYRREPQVPCSLCALNILI